MLKLDGQLNCQCTAATVCLLSFHSHTAHSKLEHDKIKVWIDKIDSFKTNSKFLILKQLLQDISFRSNLYCRPSISIMPSCHTVVPIHIKQTMLF